VLMPTIRFESRMKSEAQTRPSQTEELEEQRNR